MLVLCGAALLMIGCSRVATSNWVSFADSLEKGSEVTPYRIFNFKGEVDVVITKAADPEWKPDVTQDYPYAGVMMRLHRSGVCVDLSKTSTVTLDYKLVGEISMRTVQENIKAGQEHRLELVPHDEFTVEEFRWDQFMQPDWVEDKQDIDLACLTSIMFTNSSKELSQAHLVIRNIEFHD